MIWYTIIMQVLFNISYHRASVMYEMTGSIHYEMEQGYCLEFEAGDVPAPGTPHYEALIGVGEFQKGSGMGMTPHLWLGPGGGSGTISPPSPNDPHAPPRNDGEAGNPIIVSPDPTPPPPSSGTSGTCATIGDVGDYTYGVTDYIIDAVGVNYSGSATMTSARRAKFVIVQDMMKRAILTNDFKNRVLGGTYCNSTQGSTSTGNNPTAVWNEVCNGNERWRPTNDNAVDAYQSVYYTTSGVVGYVNSTSSNRIFSNVRIIDNYDPSTLAGHVVHEWSHLLGYSHGDGPSTCTSTTSSGDVSYKLGQFFGIVAEPLDSDYGW